MNYARPEFGRWIADRVREAKVSRLYIATLVGIDPGYMTHIGNGYVPGREVTKRLAEAIGLDVDETMVRAGFAPVTLSVAEVLSLLEDPPPRHRRASEIEKEFLALGPRDRERAGRFLRNCLNSIKSTRRKK